MDWRKEKTMSTSKAAAIMGVVMLVLIIGGVIYLKLKPVHQTTFTLLCDQGSKAEYEISSPDNITILPNQEPAPDLPFPVIGITETVVRKVILHCDESLRISHKYALMLRANNSGNGMLVVQPLPNLTSLKLIGLASPMKIPKWMDFFIFLRPTDLEDTVNRGWITEELQKPKILTSFKKDVYYFDLDGTRDSIFWVYP